MGNLKSMELWIDGFVNLNDVNVWFVRTEGGNLYQEYISNSYISLGWNYYDSEKIKSETALDNKKLIKQIEEMYSIKTGQRILNQIHNFIYKMKKNDLVLIPNKSSKVYSLVMLQEYYEEDVSYSVDQEIQLSAGLKSTNKDEAILNPYKKRWRIVELGREESRYLPPNIRIVLRNFGTMMNLTEYKEDALCAFFPFFQYKHALYLNIKVTSPEVTARTLGKLTGNVSRYLELKTGIESNSITTQTNINSPGMFQIVIDGLEMVKDLVWKGIGPIILLNVLINGGEFMGAKIPSVLHTALNYRKLKAEVDSIELSNQKTQIEVSLLNQQLKVNVPAALDTSTVEVEELRQKASALGYTIVANDIESISEEIVQAANQLRQKSESNQDLEE